MIRWVLGIIGALMAAMPVSITAADNGVVFQTVTFSDGSVGSSADHCGDTDLCATITYPNGDKLAIYSEGAAFCQPYMLHFVRTNGTQTIYEYSRTINHDPVKSSMVGTSCGRTQATQMVMDHGLVHLTVLENSDGTLKLVFSPTGTK
jgi:hypothetical protein